MISAAFTVNGASNPAAHSVSYGSTVNLELLSFAGANSIDWQIIACSDPDQAIPSITKTGTPPGRTASFVMPSSPGDDYGRTFLVKCTVTSNVLGTSGTISKSEQYAVVGVPNIRGIIPIVPGEQNYRDATHGWAPEINIALANTSSGSGSSAVLIPAPSLVATSNITLSGTQTVDGVASNTITGDVLCVGQTDSAQNGYWTPAAGTWSRPSYYDSNSDVESLLGQTGSAVLQGILGSGTVWFQSSGTTIAGNKTWNKLSTPSLLQDVLGTTLPAQSLTQQRGAAILRDPGNGRNVVDLDRADIREYGANVGGVQRTTATGTAGNAVVTLGNARNYINGNWLMLSGMGAAHGLATPSAPTLAVQGTTGARTISVKVIAITSTGGYTAASSATQVTTANATLSVDNFVEVWFAPVASAYRYIVYVQFDGAGSWTYYGGVIAFPQYDAVGRVEPQTFRIVSNTPPTVPTWLPTTAPATAVANGLRTKIISGGGTTSVTVSPAPITSATSANCDACSLIPIEDAINSDPAGYSTEIRIPRGTAYVTGQLQLRSPARFSGANGGGSGQSGSILLFRDGCGVATYNQRLAEQWQPGTQYRLGDRVVTRLRTGTTGSWTLTAIAGGAAWATSGTTEPTWNYTTGGTTPDNGHTWTFQSPGYTAGGCRFERVSIHCEGSTIPASRHVVEDDLRTGAQFLSGAGSAPTPWTANTAIALNAYRVPTDANLNGKMYKATVAGTTHVTTEPTWPRVHGATVSDGGVTWTCIDVLRRPGAGFNVATVTHLRSVQIKGFHGTGLLCTGATSGDGSACNRSTFEDLDIRNCTGHRIATYGSDANGMMFDSGTLGYSTRDTAGACTIQDNSFYGSLYTAFTHDGGARYQNQPWPNVQIMAKLHDCYTEGLTGSETDWNMPGKIDSGHHASGWRTGSNAVRSGVAASTANIALAVDSARLEFDDTGADFMSRQLTSGFERKLWGTGTVGAGTLLQEQHESLLSTKGRSRHTVRGTTSVRETAHFDARGVGEIFTADLRVGPTFATESRLGSIVATPTVGAFNAGDWLTWCLDNRRLAIKPARAGGLGATSRANSTAYSLGNIISSSSKHFVCVVPGTSAVSLPGGYASATIGTYVNDGTAVFQMWTTAQDPNLTAVPNLWADPVAVPDADTTLQYVNVNDGQSCRDMPAATANRVMTLGTTGLIAGDCFHLRQLNNVAFTITINTVDGGSVVMPANTRCWTVIKMTRAGAFTQHSAGILL